MTARYSPPLRVRRIARELRKLRDASGLSLEQAAAQLDMNRFRLGRLESGRTKPKVKDVTDAANLYGIGTERRAMLVELARQAAIRGWWVPWQDLFIGSYVSYEDEASAIREWEVQLVPGLLQTERYAREVIRLSRGGEDLDRRVQARMARKVILTREHAPAFHAVIDEGVLRRPIGDQAVMAEQMQALITAGHRDNVTLQVLPYEAGGHAGLEGAFMILAFPENEDPPIAYVEGTAGAVYAESANDVDRYTLAFGRIVDAALSPEDSAELISRHARE